VVGCALPIKARSAAENNADVITDILCLFCLLAQFSFARQTHTFTIDSGTAVFESYHIKLPNDATLPYQRQFLDSCLRRLERDPHTFSPSTPLCDPSLDGAEPHTSIHHTFMVLSFLHQTCAEQSSGQTMCLVHRATDATSLHLMLCSGDNMIYKYIPLSSFYGMFIDRREV